MFVTVGPNGAGPRDAEDEDEEEEEEDPRTLIPGDIEHITNQLVSLQ
jgi:hypothetical protein